MDKLADAREVAVDLEHQSYRSYYGFVCLMQLSTREEDFIIDTLALREELHVLNKIFTNPAIIKVKDFLPLTSSNSGDRFSMAPRAILCGCSRISIFIS